MKFYRLLLPVLVVFLFACGQSTPIYDDSTISQARQEGRLLALYQEVSTELENLQSRGRSSETLANSKQKIGTLLAQDKLTEIREMLSASSHGQLFSLQIIADARQLMKNIADWSETIFKKGMVTLENDETRTRESISSLQNSLADLPPERIEQRLAVITEIEILSGKSEDLLKENIITQYSLWFYDEADRLADMHRYPEVLDLINSAREFLGNQATLFELEKRIAARQFASRFTQALENGQPLEATGMLQEASIQALVPLVYEQVSEQGLLLVDYFNQVLQEATAKEQFLEAYEALIKARQVADLLSLDNTGTGNPESRFLDALQELSIRANAEGLTGTEYAFLKIIHTLDPDFPGIEKNLRKLAATTQEQALKRISIIPFKDTSGDHAYGPLISSIVTQALFDEIPHDIRIVEREELESIIRERNIDLDSQQPGQELAAADMLLQGTVLEANADDNPRSGRKTERVVTSYNTVSNPAYLAWQESKDREKSPEPPQTIEEPVYEDISYGITQHEKTAVLSVSYRLVDANSAKIIHTNSVNRKLLVNGESSEGVSLGVYEKPLILADIPSDNEMLRQLSQEVAEEIITDLKTRLSGTEQEHLAMARQSAANGNFAQAADHAGKALYIAEKKNSVSGEILTLMAEYALQSGL